MGKKAKVTIAPAYRVGKIGKRIYGSFLEPIGDFVVGGIYGAISFDREHVWRGASYYPFLMMKKYGRGGQYSLYRRGCFLRRGKRRSCGFHYQPELGRGYGCEGRPLGFEGYGLLEHREMYCYDDDAQDSYEKQEIVPAVNPETKMEGGIVRMKAKKLSFNMLTLKRKS